MKAETDKWYRTGAVAKALGVSQYRIRELARLGLIESELRRGYRYIPGQEVERLKREGLPPMPACPDIDDTHGTEQQEAHSAARPARGRLTEELYSEPSDQLAKSKEKLIRLEHTAEAKRLKREMREIDRAAREEESRAREAQRVQQWRDGHIRRAVERVPAEVCSDVCRKVDTLLDSVPDCANIGPKVDEIIEAALRPIRQREQEARALDAHRQRIARTVQSISLPYGATGDDREEARDAALASLSQSLQPGASDRELRIALEQAVRPVLERISRRQAEAERRRQEASHKYSIDQIMALLPIEFFYLDATDEERSQAKVQVRAALEQLPPTASGADLNRAKQEALAPFKAAIRLRKEQKAQEEQQERERERQKRVAASRTDSMLSVTVETTLRELEEDDEVSFDSYSDRCNLRDKLAQKIRSIIIEAIGRHPDITDSQIKTRIGNLVDRHYREFCDR
jgi:hypothetical protein